MDKKSFTLMETMVVIMIIGILATLGVSQYMGYMERVYDREAEANLRMILSAERVSFIESDTTPPVYVAAATTLLVNNNLRLTIPTANTKWNYSVFTYMVGGLADTDFCAQAARVSPPPGRARNWRICAPNIGARGADPQPEELQACGPCP